MVRRRLLVVSNTLVGSRMAGPGIRSLNLARELAHDFDVTLAAPTPVDIEVEGLRLVTVDLADRRRLTELAVSFDAVFAQRLPITTMARLARAPVRVVYDLYDPLLLELLVHFAPLRKSIEPTSAALRYERLAQGIILAAGDAFVCASERQRDFWLGWLAAAGRLDHDAYQDDPALRSLIDVVPFGMEVTPVRKGPRVLKGVLEGVPADARVLLWAGGIWSWLDPATIIRAVAVLGKRRDDIRLVFMGTSHPDRGVGDEQTSQTTAAKELAARLGVLDRLVVFNEGWVPYEERGRWLAEADIGVSAHFDNVETRFAFRTRLIDYLWAEVPVVTTKGDALAALIEERGSGATVPVQDVDAWVRTLDDLLNDDARYACAKRRAVEARQSLAWPAVTEPLARLLSIPGKAAPLGARVRARGWSEIILRGRQSVDYRGPTGAASHFLHLGGKRLSDLRIRAAETFARH